MSKKKKQKEKSIRGQDYYTRGGIEVADYILAKGLDFFMGSAVKYISRAGFKDGSSKIEDLKKARECLDIEIEYLENSVVTMDDIRELFENLGLTDLGFCINPKEPIEQDTRNVKVEDLKLDDLCE